MFSLNLELNIWLFLHLIWLLHLDYFLRFLCLRIQLSWLNIICLRLCIDVNLFKIIMVIRLFINNLFLFFGFILVRLPQVLFGSCLLVHPVVLLLQTDIYFLSKTKEIDPISPINTVQAHSLKTSKSCIQIAISDSFIFSFINLSFLCEILFLLIL